jgi:hypothetical protein
MQHAITVGEVFWSVAIVVGLIGLGGILLLLVSPFNPFRSGH